MNVRDPLANRVRLEQDEVHLWWRHIGEGESPETWRAWLSDEERERCERFRREGDARAFAERRCFLRSVLAGYLECSPAELRFEQNPFGKPALRHPEVDLAFSLSRSGAWILLGVTRGREVGVDVERLDGSLRDGEELSRIADRVLTRTERAVLARMTEGDRPGALIRAWARKEALLKALGLGLSREPSTVEVGVRSLGPLEPLALDPQIFPRTGGALLLDLAAPTGWVASVVAEGRDWDLLLCSRPGPAFGD